MAYGGGVDKEGNAYVARVYWSKKLEVRYLLPWYLFAFSDHSQKAVVDLFSAFHEQNQRYYFPFSPSSDGSIHHVRIPLSVISPHLLNAIVGYPHSLSEPSTRHLYQHRSRTVVVPVCPVAIGDHSRR